MLPTARLWRWFLPRLDLGQNDFDRVFHDASIYRITGCCYECPGIEPLL